METSQNNPSDNEISALINQLNINEKLENSGEIEVFLSSTTSNRAKKLFLTTLIDAENEKRLRIDAEIRELEANEKMLRIDAETREANEKMLRIEETGVGFLKLKGLPPLPKSDVSVSKPSYGKHKFELESVVCVNDGVIGIPSCCKISEFEDLPSIIWKQTVKDETQKYGRILTPWNGEVGIESFVFQVITDIVTLLKLNSTVKVCRQVKITLVKHTAGIIFMEFNGRLIGICEVKQPSFDKSDLHKLDENLQNQISNYLLQLRNIYGVQTPIAIISTYNEWLICFLRESFDYMKSNELFDSFAPPAVSSAPPSEKGVTMLHTSEVFPYDSVYLIEVLASTIYKMYHSVVIPPVSLVGSLNNEARKFGFVNKDGFVWRVLPASLQSLSYEMPTETITDFFFIQDFHGGKDGRVWLAITDTGKLAVCKISEDRCYEKEALCWNKISGSNLAYTTTLLKANALIMPFVFHAHMENGRIIFRPFGSKWSLGDCTVDDVRYSDIPGAFDPTLEHYYKQPLLVAEKALTDMANAGYKHCDLEWRHVGLRPYKLSKTDSEIEATKCDTLKEGAQWGVRPVLIDLHDTEEILTGESKQDVINEGLELLKAKLTQVWIIFKIFNYFCRFAI